VAGLPALLKTSASLKRIFTFWTVFEPNDEPLWADVRQALSDFLLEEFRAGALAGTKPEQAFFVRCDRTTMTQDDIDKFIEWVPVVSATRIPSLTDNKADVIIKTFTITEERKTQIDFSDVYFVTGQRILVKKSNDTIKEAADLGAKTVCAQRGSTSEQNITKANPAAKVLLLDSYPACLLALQQGQADAVSTDETILFGLVKVDPNTKIVGKPFSDEPYGIGVKKNQNGDRQGFVPFVNTWLAGMIQDGTWGKLYEKHITPVSGDKKTSPKG